jgi:hypothetical protein
VDFRGGQAGFVRMEFGARNVQNAIIRIEIGYVPVLPRFWERSFSELLIYKEV